MGIPEMEEYWDRLNLKYRDGSLKGDDKKIFKKFVKALKFLQNDPKYPGLRTHEISQLTKRYGIKVW